MAKKPILDPGEYGVRLWLNGEKLVPFWEDVICESIQEAEEYIWNEARECIIAEIVDWNGNVVDKIIMG